MNNKVLVTGADGMLGHTASDHLESKDMTVVRATRAKMNLLYPETFEDYIEKERPNVILHCGAFTNVDQSNLPEFKETIQTVNVEATAELARIAAEHDIAFIYISTNEVFRDTGKDGVNEDTPVGEDQLNNYGRSKAEGEKRARGNNENTIIVRVAWLFGPGYRENLVTKILRKGYFGEKIEGTIDQLGNPTGTIDVALALGHVIEDIGNYYLSKNLHIVNSGGPVSRHQQIKYILEVAGYDIEVEEVLHKDSKRPVKVPQNGVLLNTKLPTLPDWQDATKRYVDYLNKQES